jgi:predicted transposase YdaD
MRHSPVLAEQLFRGVLSMKESSTYQAILEEGRTEGAVTEARKLLRRFGERAFGPPDARISTTIESIDDLSRLEALLDQLPSAASWHELLGQSARSGRGKRRQSP